jgi:hypothetical protein
MPSMPWDAADYNVSHRITSEKGFVVLDEETALTEEEIDALMDFAEGRDDRWAS